MTKSEMFIVDNHPVIPPSDLLKKWEDKWFDEEEHADVLLIQAYQAGADEELKACCEWLENQPQWMEDLRTARRPKPKPPSLKEQALTALDEVEFDLGTGETTNTIRRALEQLPE